MKHDHGESDGCVVPAKPPNKDGTGWPAMVALAVLALEPSFASVVRLPSPVEWSGRVLLRPFEHLDPVLSVLFVYGSGVVLAAALVLSALVTAVQQGRRAREPRDAVVGASLLEAGAAVVPFYFRHASGARVPVEAVLVGASVEVPPDDDEDAEPGYWLRLATPDGALRLVERVPEDVHSRLPDGALVPVISVPGRPSMAQVGVTPRAHALVAAPLAGLVTLLGLAFLAVGPTGRKWYEGEKVVDHGRGKLPGPEPSEGTEQAS